MIDDYEGLVLVDSLRSVELHGNEETRGYMAAVGVDSSGHEYLALARVDLLGRRGHPVDLSCADVAHEQLGPLPLEFVRSIVVASRTHRCGRTTQAGRPCRIRVRAAGDACEWHRSRADA